MMLPGMKKGLIRRGPRSFSVRAFSAMPSMPPMPEPIITPVALRSPSVSGFHPASRSASSAAAMPYRMKSPILRSSLGSRNASGLKVPSLPSPRGITWAILHGRSSTSNSVILRAALLPERRFFHPCSTPTPNGESRPMPVTTTRLIAGSRVPIGWEKASGGSLVDVLHGIADRENCLGRIIRDLDAEFLFERHHELDRVQAVCAEVIDEAGRLRNLVGFHAKMLYND